MLLRIAALAAVTILALACPPRVQAAPSDGDPTVEVNRRLAFLTTQQPPQRSAQPFGIPAAPGVAPQTTGGRSLLLSPAVLLIASRFTSAERILHFQSRGFDANLWGVLNGGRGIKIKYVIRF